MILRNGINCTLRARGRSVLFTALILILTVALTLGMGTWAYSAQLLSQMDKTYTSIALVEYMGADYPDQDVADTYARSALATLDTSAIRSIDGVKLWENTDRTLASVNGYTRLRGDVPYEDYGVLICTSFVPTYTNGWREYTIEELPSEYVAVDQLNWVATMKFDSGEQTDWIEYYHEKSEDGFLRSWYDETATLQEHYIPAAEMPDEYIYRESVGNSRFFSYNYVKNGVIANTIQENARSDFEPMIAYFPETDEYYGEGKVIRAYTGICVDPLYSREYNDDFLMTLMPDQHGLDIESGKRYIVHGIFSPDGNNHNNFVLVPFYDGCEILPWQEIKDGTYNTIFDTYAQKYAVANSFVRLESSSDIGALEVFQQNTLRLQEGRFPEAGESGTCVISHDIALQLDAALGDTIDLTVLNSAGSDRFELTASDEKALQVVGITTTNEEYIGCVWVSDAEGGFSSPLFGYQLGQAVLENRTARQAADAIENLCGDNIRVTLYDQGYSAAAQPLQTMQTTAMAVTIAAACGAVAVLLLFAFLFVGRQRENVQVLVSLGTPASKIRLWLLSGAALICGIASAIGAAIGGVALGNIIKLAKDAAIGLYTADQRYSEAAIGFVKDAVGIESLPIWPAFVSGIAVFLLALVFCLLFLRLARRQSIAKRGKQILRVPKSGTSVSGRGALRFAMLSAKRGGWRSGVVSAAALILSLLLGILAFGAQSWSDQIDTLYRDTDITGLTVSTNGRQDTGLLVPATSVRSLWKSGLLEDISVSIGWNYWLTDEMPDFGTGEFAEYRREEWIRKQPELMALNDLSAAPEFMHGQTAEITWLEGYDETFLEDTEYCSFMTTRFYAGDGAILPRENEEIAYPCLVSEDFLQRRELVIGENFSVAMQFAHYPWEEERYVQLFPVGVFTQTCSEANVYVPLSFWCDPAWINGDEDVLAVGERPSISFRTSEDRDKYLYNTTSFSTCVFTLNQASDLEQMRDYLAQKNFSQVRNLSSNRTTILLRDQTFVETVDGLGRYISFSQLLFPVLFAVVALLGFIISWLMISGRRMEFAILRGLGTSKVKVFFSFFLEQLILCIIGCVLGALCLLLITGIGFTQCIAVLIFLICYLTGCALSVIVVGRTHLMSLLSERE